MKRILLTSAAALIASAGMAAAEVKVSGEARFGLAYSEDRKYDVEKIVEAYTASSMAQQVAAQTATGLTDAQIKALKDVTLDAAGRRQLDQLLEASNTNISDIILATRFRANVDVSTETDGGAEFGGRIRVQAEEDAYTGEGNVAEINGPNFYVKSGGLKVYAGNISGALDSMNGYYGTEPGLETFIGQYSGVNYGFLGYSSGGAGANAVNFSYDAGSFGFIASYNNEVNDQDQFDMSVKYGFGDITAAVGWGQTKAPAGMKKESLAVLTLAADMGAFSGSIFVADDDVRNVAQNGTAYGLSGTYDVGGATKLQFAWGDGSADADKNQLGLGIVHDLGGGASLKGGIGRTKIGDGEATNRADFGAKFDF